MRRLTISTSKVNRKGYRTIPSGIRLDAYRKCSILLWNHNGEPMSIGRVVDLRIEDDGSLTGLPEFDEGDPIAMDCKRKYVKGYIHGCSMGHNPITLSDDPSLILPGQTRQTVTETELLEISMANLPADRGAVGARLSLGDEKIDKLIPLLKLSETPKKLSSQKLTNDNNIMENNFKKTAQALSLPSDATEADVLKAIETLKLSLASSNKLNIDSVIEQGKTKGLIDDANEETYRKLAASDLKSVSDLVLNAPAPIQEKKKETPAEAPTVAEMLKAAGGKSTLAEEDTFEKLSKENPAKLAKIKNEDPEKYEKLAADYAAGYSQA